MDDKDIVLLGDCIATGTDVLLPEIINQPDCTTDDNGTKENYEKQLIKWFLQNKNTKIQIQNILKESYLFKIAQEKSLAWPAYIDGCLNLAVVGETFQGMHKKIKSHIQNNKKPKLVIITDFSESHRCVVIRHNHQQYVVKRDLFYLDHKQDIWPKAVYAKFLDKVRSQEALGQQYQTRKNQKSLDQLTKFLNFHQIPYKFCWFRQTNHYLSIDKHDFTSLAQPYKNHEGKDICSKKLAYQSQMADVIKKSLKI